MDIEQDDFRYVADDFYVGDKFTDDLMSKLESANNPKHKGIIDVGHNWIYAVNSFNVGRKRRFYANILIKADVGIFYVVGLLDGREYYSSINLFGLTRKNASELYPILNGTPHRVGDYYQCTLDITGLKYAGGMSSIKKFLTDFNKPLNIQDKCEISTIV